MLKQMGNRFWISRHLTRWLRRSCALVLLAVIVCAGCSSNQNELAAHQQSAPDSLANERQVGPILVNSCFDCHAHQSSGSFVAKMAPSHLFGEAKARQAFDLSDWPGLSPEGKRAMANSIVSAIQGGSMPPGDYLTFHPSAKLSDEQKQQLAEWASHLSAAPAHQKFGN